MSTFTPEQKAEIQTMIDSAVAKLWGPDDFQPLIDSFASQLEAKGESIAKRISDAFDHSTKRMAMVGLMNNTKEGGNA
jgi:hypothetical protein